MVTKAMKNKIEINDFLTLIYWVKTYFSFNKKKFNHDNLIQQAETYRLKETPLDTTIHHIDELMIDAFQVYSTLKETEELVDQALEQIKMPSFIDKDMMKKETQRYTSIFEDLIENYKYDDPEIRGIQMGILQEKMKEYVAVEDYENAARVRDMIELHRRKQ
jgi:hypothetical protein